MFQRRFARHKLRHRDVLAREAVQAKPVAEVDEPLAARVLELVPVAVGRTADPPARDTPEHQQSVVTLGVHVHRGQCGVLVSFDRGGAPISGRPRPRTRRAPRAARRARGASVWAAGLERRMSVHARVFLWASAVCLCVSVSVSLRRA